MPEKKRNELKKIVGEIHGASEQFVDDIMITAEKYHDNYYFRKILFENLVSGISFKNKTSHEKCD